MQPEAVVSPARRFAAILALLTWVALVVFLLVAAVSRWFVLLATVTSISVFVLAASVRNAATPSSTVGKKCAASIVAVSS